MAVSSTFGAHRVTVDGDWVEIDFVGEVDRAAAADLHALLEQVLADNDGTAYVLADISAMQGLQPDARRQMAAWNRQHKVTAAAVHGGGFAVRAIVRLALTAIKLMNRDQLEVVFTADEAEARRWLAEQRSLRRVR